MEIVEEPHEWTCPYCKLKFNRTKHIFIVDGKVDSFGYTHDLMKGQYNIKIGAVNRGHNLHACRLKMKAESNGYSIFPDLEVCWNCEKSEVDFGGWGESQEMTCMEYTERGLSSGWKNVSWRDGFFEVGPTDSCDNWTKRTTPRKGFND